MGARKTRYAAIRWAAIAVGLGAAASYTGSPAASARAATMQLQQQQGPSVPGPAEGEHGAGKKGGGQFKDSAVYVDGKAMGILSFSELPPTLKPFALPEIDDLDIPRYYRLADYLEAIGVDLSRVSAMHIYGSHDRVAIISGQELLAVRDRMVFDFTQQTGGKPRARWSQLHALKHRPMVDVILGISIYVDKPVPPLVDGELVVDGKPVEGIPYVDDGIPKGTRVYVDGRLEGWVRRKTLPDKLIAPSSTRTHAKFSMDAFIAYVGGDARNAKAVDFYDGDVMLARVDGKAWQHAKGEYVFELTNRSHGQVTEFFPGDKSSKISSVQLYVHTTPPDRHPDPEALEQQAGGSDENQTGGGNGDGTGGNNGVTRETAAARGVNSGNGEDEF
jgi:hypothetical protein